MRLKLVRAGILLLAVLGVGTIGYHRLGGGHWSLVDCLYMTVITLTTVGYGEVLPVNAVAGARVFTIFLIVAGMGVVVYFASTLTAFFVEGSLGSLYGMRKMFKEINALHGHTIVCGVGRTGRHVVEELVASGRKCVVLDHDAERVDQVVQQYARKVPVFVGDATHDDDLLKAGVERASTVVVTLTSEVATLYCTLSVRQLNPKIRVIVTSDNLAAEQKFKRAGADSVIYTNIIGGRRIAAEITRPDVITFLDLLTSDPEHPLRFDQVRVTAESRVCGHSLATSGIRKAGDVLVVAMRDAQTHSFSYAPGPDRRIQAGDVLIVLGHGTEIEKVWEYVGRPAA